MEILVSPTTLQPVQGLMRQPLYHKATGKTLVSFLFVEHAFTLYKNRVGRRQKKIKISWQRVSGAVYMFGY